MKYRLIRSVGLIGLIARWNPLRSFLAEISLATVGFTWTLDPSNPFFKNMNVEHRTSNVE